MWFKSEGHLWKVILFAIIWIIWHELNNNNKDSLWLRMSNDDKSPFIWLLRIVLTLLAFYLGYVAYVRPPF